MVAPSLSRLQFSLRWLFLVVTAIAVCAFVLRIAGIAEAIGVAAAFTLGGICLRLPQFRFRRSLRVALLTLATLIVWMVGFDYSDFWVGCNYCHSHWWSYEIRVFHQPILTHPDDDHHPTLRLIAEDLGAPCPHKYEREDHGRLWGLIWPGPHLFSGTCCLSGDEWYHDDVRQHVRGLGTKNPQLGKDFQKALLQHDYKTQKKLIAGLHPPPADDPAAK